MSWALFLTALIAVESGGNPRAIGDSGRAYGPLQIHQAVVDDVNRIHGFNYQHDDMFSEVRARHVAVHYLRYWGGRYEQRTGMVATPEVYARIWNGGPNGPSRHTTDAYWQKVRVKLEGQE